MAKRVKIFFDGGCRPAPHGLETAVVIAGRVPLQQDLGPGTSMDAEWLALIHAVKLAQALDVTDALFLGDARAVVNQARGAAKARGSAIAHLAALHVLTGGAPLRVRYIKRTQNLAGIALARAQAPISPRRRDI